MTHDQLCLGCNCEDGDHWIDCTCRCATIGRIREQIAKEMGLTRERVRQIEFRALLKLRRIMRKHGYELKDLIPD